MYSNIVLSTYIHYIALFSRHNVSITMTRSIGDRHAARTCVCTPEVTKFILPSDQYARIIMGSDGLYDVMTSDRVAGSVATCPSPVEAAKYLADKARCIREDGGMKIDDITCVIIDINPLMHDFTSSDTPCCIIN